MFFPDFVLSSGALEKTFFMLMGDHGFRMDFNFGGTGQGKTEASMPAFALLPPKDFSSVHPERAKVQDPAILLLSLLFINYK